MIDKCHKKGLYIPKLTTKGLSMSTKIRLAISFNNLTGSQPNQRKELGTIAQAIKGRAIKIQCINTLNDNKVIGVDATSVKTLVAKLKNATTRRFTIVADKPGHKIAMSDYAKASIVLQPDALHTSNITPTESELLNRYLECAKR